MGDMKLTKKKWLFLGIGIFVLVSAGLGRVWAQRVQEQEQLKQELSLAQLRLTKSADMQQLSSRQEELQTRLIQLPLQVTSAKASLSQSLETIEVDETLFGIAEISGVQLRIISSSPPTDIKLDGIPYSVLHQSLQIEGSEGNILDFIRKCTEKFPTGMATSVQIAKGAEPTPTPIQESTVPIPAPTSSPLRKSSTIEILIYTYAGE